MTENKQDAVMDDYTIPFVTENYNSKGGMNGPVSGIKKRPAPPAPIIFRSSLASQDQKSLANNATDK